MAIDVFADEEFITIVTKTETIKYDRHTTEMLSTEKHTLLAEYEERDVVDILQEKYPEIYKMFNRDVTNNHRDVTKSIYDTVNRLVQQVMYQSFSEFKDSVLIVVQNRHTLDADIKNQLTPQIQAYYEAIRTRGVWPDGVIQEQINRVYKSVQEYYGYNLDLF